MAKKIKTWLADDIRVSFEEALRYARGEKVDVIVHRVVPSAAAARAARRKLGIEPKPRGVRRALRKELAS